MLQILELERGKEHSEYGIALDSLGKLRHLQRRFAEASENFSSALSVKKKSLGANHFEVAVTSDHLATNFICGFEGSRGSCSTLSDKALISEAQNLYQEASLAHLLTSS